ncbi:MAG: PAP2 family protein [Rhodocyclales bacterium GT-UBC]|nr:MAG: PAP2 family protein [Rhodocyclales bacterium GT-UBC]
MNDRLLRAPSQGFGRFLLGLCLLIVAAAWGLSLGNGWQAGFQTIQAASRLLPEVFWSSLTTLGDERMLLALLLPFCLRYPRVFWAIVVASLIAGLICRGFKIGLPMPRPAAVLDPEQITVIGARLTRHSFPSGHTASAFAFAMVWVAQLGWRRAMPILVLAFMVGLSRVAVGAHWPMDVLAGALVGSLSGWAGLVICRHFRWGLRTRVHWTLVGIAALAVASLPFDGQGYPDSLPFRLAACGLGLSAFYAAYLQPVLRYGWQVASRPTALVWRAATKA